VFAIRGGWGYGKSSLKNLITERFDAQEKGADWLNFNPWQWGDSDAIARALFAQIADRLGGKHSEGAIDRAQALRRYGAILSGAVAPLKKAEGSSKLVSNVLTNASLIALASAVGFDLPAAATVAAAFAFLSVAAPLLGSILSHFGRDVSSDPLDKVRRDLETRLRELDRPLVVFVDDIDRLEPEQIRVLLRQVKANANLPNIVFVLLFQPNIIERALDPVAANDGRAFLEKIVQANFDLPIVPVSVVHHIFGTELSELISPFAIEANGFSHTRGGNAFVGCIQPYLRNLRDARRLISSIAVHMPLHAAGDIFEVNIVDFLVLETLRVFEPSLHGALFRERELLLQERRGSVNREAQDRTAVAQLLGIVPDERRGLAQNALKFLFPQIEWALGGTRYAEDFNQTWHASRRACASRYFPRYFELQTASGEISEWRFVEFLNSTPIADHLAAEVANLESDGLLTSLAGRLDESVDRLPVENAAVLLPAMYSIAQKLAGFSEAGPFNSPWISAWRAINWFLKRIPERERGLFALDAFRQTEALSVAATLIHLSSPPDQSDSQTEDFEPALDTGTVEAMKAEWLRLIRIRAQRNDELIAEPSLVSWLYRWRDYSGSFDEPREWVTEAVRTDDGFASIATRVMTRGSSHSAGDWVTTPVNKFNRETIDDLIGLSAAKARCDAIDPIDFPEHEEALQTLKRSVDTWLGLRDEDFPDS
jgi:predicted KAP-like P-loop ATPase